MPKPLRLFIRPPYDNPPGLWQQVHGYGIDQRAAIWHSYTLLRTTGSGQIVAACNGKLSMRPPGGGNLDPSEEIVQPNYVLATLPSTVNLYLHTSPLIMQDPLFRARAAQNNDLTGFAYLNVETASLEANMAELLDDAVIPTGSLSRSQVVELLVRGTLDVYVTAGHALCQAATQGAPAGFRQIGFTALTRYGPIDPSHAYDWMRDYVEDGQFDLDSYLNLAPKRWPVIDATISNNDAIDLTQSVLYPMTVLQHLQTSRTLNATQWRTIGNNQKTLWRSRLLQRVGHSPTGNTDPPFQFDDWDWQNIFQLEAVVELYANYDDPWRVGDTPLNPGDARFISIDFLDPSGVAATVVGNVVTLDGNPDLTRVRQYYNNRTGNLEFYDTIQLESDTVSATRNRMYLITAVDYAAHTVTVDGNPVLIGASSPWKINLRPVIAIIDSFGGRLQGTNATVSATNTLQLDGLPTPSRVNPNFDTIYLPSDTFRAKRTYRITAVNDAARTVTLDDNPVLDGGSSRWHIPSGISGELPALNYNLGPGQNEFDHYDGILFVVFSGRVHRRIRWSSYTSRNHPAGSEELSSIRGNKTYDFCSYRSGRAFINYSFRVADTMASYDGVRVARFYFATPVTRDEPPVGTNPGIRGKTELRLHQGNINRPAGGTGSAGCLVSTSYYDLRDQLIDLYQAEYTGIHGQGNRDAEIDKARNLTHQQSQTLWTDTQNNVRGANHLIANNWNGRMVGTVWIIRPDERPI